MSLKIQEFAKKLLEKILSSSTTTSLSLIALLSAITTSYVLLKWIRQRRYFPSLNIPGPAPKLLLGNFLDLASKGIVKNDEDLINQYGKIVGYHEVGTPVILCSDLDMIRHIMIKDTHYFTNRRSFEALLVDPLDKFVSNLKDDDWKNVRSIISTTFTSGKLKEMLEIMSPCVDVLIDYLKSVSKISKEIEAKETFQKLTFDVMTSCCFGIKTDSINNPNDEAVKNLTQLLDLKINFKMLLAVMFPKLMKKLGEKKIIEMTSSKSLEFFAQITNLTLERRRSKEQFRKDFIQIMVEHEESSKNDTKLNTPNSSDKTKQIWKPLKKTLTNTEILAQAIGFILAGSDTSSTTMGYTAYLLAKHSDVQEKLYNEIKIAYNKHGEVNYEMIHSIEYLDMVVDETLRLFPPALRTDRLCSADYTYKNMKIPKGTVCSPAIWVIHHDPSIYPEPEKFIPERFTPEAKSKRDNCAFIPFGTGPRACIGLRFALQQIKLILCKVLLEFEFVVSERTPVKIEVINGFCKSKDPIYLKFIERNL